MVEINFIKNIRIFLKQQIIRYKNLIANFGYLTILQLINMLLPLITYPYLIRVLGAELYGWVVFSQSIATYFSILINYGFNFYATKEIAENKENNRIVSLIFSTVINIKLILFIVSSISIILIATHLNTFETHSLLLIFSIGILINETLFPLWFFQGIEKMKYITLISLISKSLFTILIFVFINQKEDYIFVPLLTGIGNLSGAVISLIIIIKNYNIKYTFSIKTILKYFKGSFPLFVSNFVMIIRSETNTLIIGAFIGMKEVSYYDLINKIVILFRGLFRNIENVIFPSLSKNKEVSLSRKVFALSLSLSTITYILLLIFKNYIIMTLGGIEMIPAGEIYYILGLWLVFATLSSSIGSLVLVTNNKNKAFLNSISISLFVFLILNALLIFFGMISIYFLSWSLITSIIIESILRLYYCKKYKLLNWVYKLK